MATTFHAVTMASPDAQLVLTDAAAEKVWGRIHLKTAAGRSAKWVLVAENLRTQDMAGIRSISTENLQAAQAELDFTMGKHGVGLADYGITKNVRFYIDLELSQALVDAL